jgi:hypothetical protein
MFADVDLGTAGLYGAITAVLVAVANWIQSVTKDRKDAKVAAEKAAADKKAADEKAVADKKALDETAAKLAKKTEAVADKLAVKTEQSAKAVTEKLDAVHKTVNGEGLGKAVDEIKRIVEEVKGEVRGTRSELAAHVEEDRKAMAEVWKHVGKPQTEGDARGDGQR